MRTLVVEDVNLRRNLVPVGIVFVVLLLLVSFWPSSKKPDRDGEGEDGHPEIAVGNRAFPVPVLPGEQTDPTLAPREVTRA